MILIIGQMVDGSTGRYNGGFSQQFYNLNEAIAVAIEQSKFVTGFSDSQCLINVYSNGELIGTYYAGQPV
jgi:hypothetical protein